MSDDGPPADPDADLRSDVTIAELDELEQTTIRLPRAVVALIEKKTQVNPLQLTSDAIPVALLAKALPFVDREVTVELPPDSKLQPALPFRAEPTPKATPAPVAAPSPQAAPEPKPKPLDVRAVATIAAEIVNGSHDAYARHGLSADAWLALEQTWFARIVSAIERGDRSLRDDYDAAFLAARSTARGAFGDRALAELKTELAMDRIEDASPAMGIDVADASRYRRARSRSKKS